MSTDTETTEAGQSSLVTANPTVAGRTSEDIASQHAGLTQPTPTAEEQGSSQDSAILSGTASQETTSIVSRRRSIHNPATGSKWFELCVNYGLGQKRLREISLAGIKNDTQLFQAIKARYESLRAHRIKDLYLVTPVDIQYVQFCLEDRYQVVVHNRPVSWPPKEVLGWEWDQPPVRPTLGPPPISADTFLHYLRNKKSHRGANWLNRIVKKLDKSMIDEATEMPFGWGILIMEGLNKRVAANILWLSVFAVFAASTAWSILKQNGLSVGSFALAALALVGSFITSKFFEHIEA